MVHCFTQIFWVIQKKQVVTWVPQSSALMIVIADAWALVAVAVCGTLREDIKKLSFICVNARLCEKWFCKLRSSHWRCPKMFLSISQFLQECTCCRPACNFIKTETLAQVFFCEFCEISKNTFFIEHLWWLLFVFVKLQAHKLALLINFNIKPMTCQTLPRLSNF